MSDAGNFMRALFFDQDYYLAQKAAACNVNGDNLTAASVLDAIISCGMTPWEHYVRYGSHEYNAEGNLGIDPSALFSTHRYYYDLSQLGKTTIEAAAAALTTDPITDYANSGYAKSINPDQAVENAILTHDSRADAYSDIYFNELEYLENKTASLNASGEGYWTVEATAAAIANAGMTPWQHFIRHGAYEIDAQGNIGIDPSKYFDASAYYMDKAAQAGLSLYDTVAAFEACGLDPIRHYALYGRMEGIVPHTTCFTFVDGDRSGSTTPLSGDVLADSMLTSQWSSWPNWNKIGLTQGNILYYHFSTNDELSSMKNVSSNATPSNDAQQEAYLQGLSVVSNVTGIQFAEVNNASEANLLFFSDFKAAKGNNIEVGWTTVGGELPYGVAAVVLNNVERAAENTDPRAGTTGFTTILHELGHAMGLKHSFDIDTANYATLPTCIDNTAWTLMSYTHAEQMGIESWAKDGDPCYEPVDLLGLEYLYGGDGLNGASGIVYDGS